MQCDQLPLLPTVVSLMFYTLHVVRCSSRLRPTHAGGPLRRETERLSLPCGLLFKLDSAMNLPNSNRDLPA